MKTLLPLSLLFLCHALISSTIIVDGQVAIPAPPWIAGPGIEAWDDEGNSIYRDPKARSLTHKYPEIEPTHSPQMRLRMSPQERETAHREYGNVISQYGDESLAPVDPLYLPSIVSLDETLFPNSIRDEHGDLHRSTEYGVSVQSYIYALGQDYGFLPALSWQWGTVGFSALLTQDQIEAMLDHEAVEGITRDQPGEYQAIQDTSQDIGLWGLDRIDEDNISSEDVYRYHRTGEGITIAVLDSGVQGTHEEFGYLSGAPGSRVLSGYSVYSNLSPNLLPRNAADHGTNVASSAAGLTFGVAKNAKILPINIGDANLLPKHSLASLTAGVDLLIDHVERNSEDVIIAVIATVWVGDWAPPLGTSTVTEAAAACLESNLQVLINKGVPVFVAAGNQPTQASYLTPSRYHPLIIVGSIDNNDLIPPLTAYGEEIDLMAPGFRLGAALVDADDEYYGYTSFMDYWGGTSAAAPHVAGSIARMWEAEPHLNASLIQERLKENASKGKVAKAALNAGRVPADVLKGTPDRVLKQIEWWYPFHQDADGGYTSDEWVNSDIPYTGGWFWREPLGDFWTSPHEYPFVWDHSGQIWLEFLHSDLHLLFRDTTTNHLYWFPYSHY